MKKLLAFSLLGSSLLLGPHEIKADWDKWGYTIDTLSNTGINVYTFNSSTGEETLRNTYCLLGAGSAGPTCQSASRSFVNESNGNYVLEIESDEKYYQVEYNLNSNTFTKTETVDTFGKYYAIQPRLQLLGSPDGAISNAEGAKIIQKKSDGSVQIGGDTNDIDVVEDGLNIDGDSVITKNSDGSIQIGTDGNDIDITSEGLNIDGNPLITQKENGEIHIGKNSLITTKEEKTLSDGTKVQPLYAEDADGNRIPINIDGSKLLIDGEEVTAGGDSAQVTTNKNNITTNTSNISTNTSNISTNTSNISTNTSNISTNTSNISTNTSNIKNLGEGIAGSTALTAALSALPQTSKESKLSCGIGTGAYSSRYAVGFGCASKVNERVDINAGGSYVFGGSKSYGKGTLDSGVVKAGFVFKLGELKNPIQISMKDKKKMEAKIESLEESNNEIISQNEDLKQKNQSIISQNKSLLARLERLEKIALSTTKSKDLATIKLP